VCGGGVPSGYAPGLQDVSFSRNGTPISNPHAEKHDSSRHCLQTTYCLQHNEGLPGGGGCKGAMHLGLQDVPSLQRQPLTL